MKKKKKSRLLLASAIIGSIYLVFLLFYFGSFIFSSNPFLALGASMAIQIVMPHMICAVAALIFNWIGWAKNVRWAALTAAILYAISIVMMITYFFGVILEMIFCFIAFARMKNPKKKNMPEDVEEVIIQ